MSFNAGPDMESGQVPDFDTLSQKVTDELERLSGSINNIRRLLKASSSSRASHKFEERLRKATESASEEFAQFGDNVKVISEWDTRKLSATQRFMQDKLNKEFGNIVNEFRALQKNAYEVKKQNVASATAVQQDERTPLMSETSQPSAQYGQRQVLDVVNQDDVEFQNSLISEREEDIRGIEQSVTEINSIFKDLGTLVSEQGAQIDTVEENVSSLATNTENAAKQLTKANEYQKKRRNWSCCVLAFLIVVLTVILLAVSL